jgi:hypothetical protein
VQEFERLRGRRRLNRAPLRGAFKDRRVPTMDSQLMGQRRTGDAGPEIRACAVIVA